MTKMICIVGPTASGKSSLAMRVAKEFDGEIICADSQTLRKGLDIGTAKPSKQEQSDIKHHLLDVIGPYDTFSAAEFKRQTEAAINDIHQRDKLPIVVGGTGLYVDALLYDFSFNRKADPSLRDTLNDMSVKELQDLLVDTGIPFPENNKNPRHLIRAIESAGETPQRGKQRTDTLLIGLDPGKELLLERIEQRVADMLQSGFVAEVRTVLNQYGPPPDAWDAIGYKIVYEHLKANHDVDEEMLKQQIVIAHRQYAKRQRAWFKRNDNINWFEQSDDALTFIREHL